MIIDNKLLEEDVFKSFMKEYDFPKEEWDNVSNEAKNLVKKMIEQDPEKRISWEEYFKHTFLTLNQILITLKGKTI